MMQNYGQLYAFVFVFCVHWSYEKDYAIKCIEFDNNFPSGYQ